MGHDFLTWLMTVLDVPEALAGDLLEQRRNGRSDWWFWRQTVAALVVASGPCATLLGVTAVFLATSTRELFDTFAPPANYGFRSAVTTYTAIATYLAAGCYAAFRNGRLQSGVWLAAVSHVVGHLLTIGFSLALYAGLIANDLAKRMEFDKTGGFGELFFLPVMLLPVVAMLGVIGATVGSIFRRLFRPAPML